MNPLKPNRHMRDESHTRAQLHRNLPLVNMIRQTIRNDIIRQILHIILWARFRPRPRKPRNAKDRRLPSQKRHQRGNPNLRGRGIAAGIVDAGSPCDFGAVDQLRETVGPVLVEAVVGAQVDDDAGFGGGELDGVDEGFADAVGEGHDPAVDFAAVFFAADVFGHEVLVRDVALVVAFELLAGGFAG